MSTTALAAVLTKFAGLNVAGKAVAGLAVAAGAVGGVGGATVVAQHVADAPESTPAAVVQVDSTAGADVTTPGADASTDADADADAGVDPTTGSVDAGAGAKGAGATDLPDAAAFGQGVAADAQDAVNGVEGDVVAARARALAAARSASDRLVEVPAAASAAAGASVTGAIERP